MGERAWYPPGATRLVGEQGRDGFWQGNYKAAVETACGEHPAMARDLRRRLEELGTAGGVTVIDDFAHHPTAVAKSLGGLRQRYPGRRVVALFEPRSLTAGRAFFFDAYREAFAGADAVLLAPLFHRQRLTPEERLDTAALARRLAVAGVRAEACDSVGEVLERALGWAADGDVMVTMSSGAFEGLPHRLLEALSS